MKINTIELLEDLKERTDIGNAIVSFFWELDESDLRYKPSPTTWSVLECVAHLNRYYAFYIPLLNEALGKQVEYRGLVIFKTGVLGDFFVRLMEARAKKIKKMKAISYMDPNGCDLKTTELALFMNYQLEFLSIMDKCKNYDLTAPRIPTVMSKWVTISLGDTLRFLVTHNERHLLQAQNCLQWTMVKEK